MSSRFELSENSLLCVSVLVVVKYLHYHYRLLNYKRNNLPPRIFPHTAPPHLILNALLLYNYTAIGETVSRTKLEPAASAIMVTMTHEQT